MAEDDGNLTPFYKDAFTERFQKLEDWRGQLVSAFHEVVKPRYRNQIAPQDCLNAMIVAVPQYIHIVNTQLDRNENPTFEWYQGVLDEVKAMINAIDTYQQKVQSNQGMYTTTPVEKLIDTAENAGINSVLIALEMKIQALAAPLKPKDPDPTPERKTPAIVSQLRPLSPDS